MSPLTRLPGKERPEALSASATFRSEGMLLLTQQMAPEPLTGAAAITAAVAAVPGGLDDLPASGFTTAAQPFPAPASPAAWGLSPSLPR